MNIIIYGTGSTAEMVLGKNKNRCDLQLLSLKVIKRNGIKAGMVLLS